MLTERIIGAFTFRKGVYAEVEQDTTFTTTAWVLIIVIGFLNQLGTRVFENPIRWLIGSIIGTIFVVLGFAVAAYIINWVGRTVFNAEVTFEELVRTLGLAYVWNIVGVFGALVAFSPALSCVTAPARFLAWILGLIAWFMAAKEALDLEWVETIITVVIGWVVMFAITLLAGVVLGLLGFGAAVVGGILGS
jgi:hypothetical protein